MRNITYRTQLLLVSQAGYALLGTLLLTAVLMSLLATHMKLTRLEVTSTRYSKNMVHGFYTAEAGLNIRAQEVRSIFDGYNRPTGTSPSAGSECESGNMGSGDFACSFDTFGKRDAVSFLQEDPANPHEISVPVGERFQNLNAQEYRYVVVSKAVNTKQEVEALLELHFKSRLVPMFQFAAFYDKDLEIAPGPTMQLAGPVHSNGDLYLNANNGLDISGQVTTSGILFRGRKNDSSCGSGAVRVLDPVSLRSLIPSCSSRTEVLPADLLPFNGMIQRDVEIVEVPEPEFTDPVPGEVYWDKADLRLMLHLDASNNPVTTHSSTGVEVRNVDGSVHAGATGVLDSCSGGIGGQVVEASSSFYNNREGSFQRLLEVDMEALFNCIQTAFDAGGPNQLLQDGRALSDQTEGGLVFHFSVDGPDATASASDYGVRVRNGARLQSSLAGAQVVRGLTVVSDQALYVLGDYNAVNKIPASFLVDTFNVLSNNWNTSDATSTQSLSNRNASDTTIQAAVLAGTDFTGGQDGVAGQGGGYNGGLENYPRFHERWNGDRLTYYGSFVSLDAPRRAQGPWVYGGSVYTAPIRDWHYDTDFNSAQNLPPLSPRFVYLRQELFLRDFVQ